MRLRITFAKAGALRYTGNLDLHRIWERTTRRAGLPLAYTHGFHPGPRIQIAAALPLGFLGRAELVDLWLEEEDGQNWQPGELAARLQAAAPSGLQISHLERVAEPSPALQTLVEACEYEVILLEPAPDPDVRERVDRLLSSPCLPRERRGKTYDLRPLVLALEALEGPEFRTLRMRLAAREGSTGRPEEVLVELGLSPESARIERTQLIFRSGATLAASR